MRILILTVALLLSLGVHAFVVEPRSWSLQRASGFAPTARSTRVSQTSPRMLTSQLRSEKDDSDIGGIGRGNIILGVVLLITIWMFSIPPYYRRVHFCSTPVCEQNRAACYDCLTLSEWTAGVADYYKNGGGVHFDFTISPETREIWSF
jgi:hypothetical protein